MGKWEDFIISDSNILNHVEKQKVANCMLILKQIKWSVFYGHIVR